MPPVDELEIRDLILGLDRKMDTLDRKIDTQFRELYHFSKFRLHIELAKYSFGL
jgi:hypothetical protein